MATVSMLTTLDNPFDPFSQFDEWYAWDERAGYHTTSFLARIVKTSDDIYFFGVITSNPRYGIKTFGTLIEPSACW